MLYQPVLWGGIRAAYPEANGVYEKFSYGHCTGECIMEKKWTIKIGWAKSKHY